MSAVSRRFAEGKLPRERTVDDDSDAVAVRLRPDLHRRGLLGGHVLLGADDHVGLGLLAGAVRFHDEAEVEEDDAPLGGHEDVRGLDVAMHLPGRVKRAHAANELREDGAELLLVERREPGRPRTNSDMPRARRARSGRLETGRSPSAPSIERGGVTTIAPDGRGGGIDERVGDRAVLGGLAHAAPAVPVHVREEVLAIDELHREKPPPRVLEELAQGSRGSRGGPPAARGTRS